MSGKSLLGIREELSARDDRILRDLRRLRVLTGHQLERLHFSGIAGASRGRTRRRVLSRLIRISLVVALERRIGGVRAGSAGLVYALSAAGQRLLDLQDGSGERRRAPHTPGAMFLAHELAISELYVELQELAPESGAGVVAFQADGEAEWLSRDRYGRPELLRPDAFVVLATGTIEDVWWVEVDRSTESLPRLTAKLGRYMRFANGTTAGPQGVVPKVLLTVPDERRLSAVRQLETSLNAPTGLVHVVVETEAAGYLLDELHRGEIEKPP